MQILLVEDEDPKRDHIKAFLESRLPLANIETARSVRSAIFRLKSSAPALLLLDMSLPTFDVAADEPGGRPQGFGGMEVLRYMDRYRLSVPTIVITAYEAFFSQERKGIDLRSLSDELKEKHPRTYCGLIYYNSIFGGWQEHLSELLDKHLPEGKAQ